MPTFIAHSEEDIETILKVIGISDPDQLYSHIPAFLKPKQQINLENGKSELETLALFQQLSAKNIASSANLTSFAGFGIYDHYVFSATKHLASRSEFVTAYTPYQAEVSQGILQILFEFQSLVSRLSGLGVSNASLYDGANALSEAVHMAMLITRKNKAMVSTGVHPHWRAVLKTIAAGSGHIIEEIDLDEGLTPKNLEVPDDVGALVVANPNFLGYVEDLTHFSELAHRVNALLIACYDPVSVAVLKNPGESGADVGVAEGQSIGMPPSFGGPLLGLLSAKKDFVRFLPGRIVGRTTDRDAKNAYVTTLRTREQDIRRERASSNVCTNQTLNALTFTFQLSLLGSSGLKEVALRSATLTRYLFEQLLQIPGISPLYGNAFFREFALKLPISTSSFLNEMATRGFLAGCAIDDFGFKDTLLVTATEKRSIKEINSYIAAAKEILK